MIFGCEYGKINIRAGLWMPSMLLRVDVLVNLPQITIHVVIPPSQSYEISFKNLSVWAVISLSYLAMISPLVYEQEYININPYCYRQSGEPLSSFDIWLCYSSSSSINRNWIICIKSVEVNLQLLRMRRSHMHCYIELIDLFSYHSVNPDKLLYLLTPILSST